MAKQRSWLRDYSVYFLVRSIVCIIQMLTWRRALELANGLAWLAHRVDRRHRDVATENIRHAFPELDESAVASLVRATYRHWARVVIEMIRLPHVLRPSNMSQYFVYAKESDFARGVALHQTKRPLMVLTGHFGNFEAMSYLLGMYGAPAAIIARRIDNPYIDRFLKVFRQKTGQDILDKNLDYPRILETLANHGKLGMVGDQDAGARGLFVEFLGRPASTFKSIALLSLEYQAPIAVMGAARVGDPLYYHIYIEDEILPEEYANRPDAVQAITQRYTIALERMVRRHPEQYFWLHRRWKHQPKVREKKAA